MVVDLDVKYLIEKKQLMKFTSFSFTILILDKLSKLPKTRWYLLQAFEKTYDSLNLD